MSRDVAPVTVEESRLGQCTSAVGKRHPPDHLPALACRHI